ncbi:MAG TPA: DUF2062 domain-containing protein [Sphingobium sp.]|uniref:DUF2062 domain-containing protein n=1 Tax=Sphingobium sp. TaxID=1912891 RepID=UPI002ED46016
MVKRHLARIYHDNVPSRESLEKNRFIRPVAHRVLAPALWRFTRRSVPRGVALGLFVGIFLLIPGLQMVGAALLALPVRANVPIAVATTFLSNPATTPFLVGLSLYVGNAMLGRTADIGRFMKLIESHADWHVWLNWLLSETAPALIIGLFVVSVVAAAIGYLIASFSWRARIGAKWRARTQERADHRAAPDGFDRMLPGMTDLGAGGSR